MREFYRGAACLVVLLGSLPAYAGPEIHSWLTDNGAKVMFYPAPELPMLDIRATFAAGSTRDAEHAGLARLTNGLLAEGAAGLDAQAIAERLERAGARFSNGSLREMAWVALRTLTEPTSQQPALDTFVQVLTQPDFNAADVERVRKQMLSALDQLEQSPAKVAERTFYRTLYADHPYGNTPAGDRDALATINLAEIRGFYQRYYVARNLTLAMVGDVDREQAQRIAQSIADGLPTGAKAPAVPRPPVLTDAKIVRV
ncbi:MAG: insulinase family protein, partial [Gammaproteobacteria bacterium]|nr:insulinase family protein [Gammaproteobacteria bacterium]